MPIQAQAADGTIHEFPDGTADAVVDKVMRGYAASMPAEKPTSQSLGFYQGVTKPLDNAAQALESGARAIGLPVDAINRGIGLSSAARAKQAHAQAIAESPNQPGGMGRFAGEVVGTLPVAVLTTNPIAAGAITGAALTDADTPGGVARDTAIGAVGGKAGDLAVRGIARVVQPMVNPYVKKLIDAGAQLTPGQILGGGWKRAEDAVRNVIPGLGDMIGNAQNNSIRSINRAASNRALAPLGQSIPAHIPAGHEMTEHVATELGHAYDNVLPHMTLTQDQQLGQDIGSIAQSNLVPSQRARLNDILDTQITGKLQAGGGSVSGDDLKGIGSELRRLAKGYSADPSFDVRELGSQIGKAADSVDQALMRQNPTYADKLRDINEGYANYARLRQAGSSVGAKEGVYTPAQLNSAVKTGDKSVGKGNFAKGRALMQDLSTAADQVVTSRINDSGTAGRLVTAGVLGGGLGAVSPTALVSSLALAAGYTKPGLKALQVVLTQRPQAAQQIADLIRKGNRAGALAAANALVGGSQALTAE
jgi:hypothetical protein